MPSSLHASSKLYSFRSCDTPVNPGGLRVSGRGLSGDLSEDVTDHAVLLISVAFSLDERASFFFTPMGTDLLGWLTWI